MNKNVLLKWVLVLMFLPLTAVFAREDRPVETFIRQVKETNTFVPVSNIWQANNNFDKTELLKNVTSAQPLTIDYNAVAGLIKNNTTAINLIVPGIGGGTYTIELAQYDFLGNNFEVHARGENNIDTKVSYTPGKYYRGMVQGIPGSVAAFSFFNNEVYGIFSIPDVGNFVLVPNTMVGEYYNSNPDYVLYNDRDIILNGNAPACATDALPMRYPRKNQRTTTTLNNNVYNNCTFVKIYEIADFATYTRKGNSTTNVTNFLTAVFNNESTLFRNEGVPVVLNYVEINTATDAYQSITQLSSIRFLKKLGYLTQNNMHGSDVAVLVSTRSGNMGGVAWLMSACSGYYAPDTAGPYAFCNVNNNNATTSPAFPTFSWDVDCTTHELGHNVGSPHTHACCWNPPARNTAIDACEALEGSCATPSPAYPVGGGTIMSYCHNRSVGTNFSKGFGQQPGDTIKYYIYQYFAPTCGLIYNPSVALATGNRKISANRECEDMSTGITYYWQDNNTAALTDDTLVLMIKKNGNNIGNLNNAAFSVSANTIANYGTGIADTILFPTGLGSGTVAPNYSMRRYWQVKATTEPATSVEVIYPFLPADSSDVDGSAPGTIAPSKYRMYKVNSPVNPSPSVDSFRYSTAANVKIYTAGATASTTRWSLSRAGSTFFAHMLMTNLSGGGTGYYNSAPVTDVDNVFQVNDGISIYPNPTNDQWFVAIDKSSSNEALIFQLYSADGKMVQVQTLQTGTGNTVSAATLPPGMYFYRIIHSGNTYTGNLIKR